MGDLEEVLGRLEGELQQKADVLKNTREGSRFVGPGASDAVLDRVAAGGTVGAPDPAYRRVAAHGGDLPASGHEVLVAVKAARQGDAQAQAQLRAKAWVEGTDASGGFLVPPEQLPGYIEARRASSPLRERCSVFPVRSNEVWVVTEGNTITVTHVAEAATKPDTTGTVAQKISTVHKVAGTTHISDELLADSNGNAAELIARQFGTQIGIEIDKAIITGTGTGQPTGIRNAAGVNAVAVDGQSGRELNNSILKAIGRLRERFFDADTIVVHPRDLTKFDLAADTQNRYLFPGGLEAQQPGRVVPDANVPTNLGAGTNESVIIVGAFRPGAYFFERQPLTLDASQAPAFLSDQTVYRGVERYGFAVVIPGAFEVLTGITP